MVRKTNHLARLILLAVLVRPAMADGQGIAVQLLFDGKPLQTTAPPEFTCHDDNRDLWINCTMTPEPATGGYVLARPAPGTYTLHVEIDENQDNPARFPGDYDVFQQFKVTRDMPVALNVYVPKLIRTIIQRLVAERESDISAYNLALTFETMSRAYWERKDADGAKAAIQEGLRRFPIGWQADQLRRTLDRYEKENR